MHDIKESAVPCCLTGNGQVQIVADQDRHGKPLRTVISIDSGLVFTAPRPTPEQVALFYADDYRKNYKNISVPKGKHIVRSGRLALARLRSLKPYLCAGDRLFDIGAGGGEFVYLSELAGLDSRGVEPNKGYAGFSQREYGIKVETGFYQDANLERDSLDCITMFHVLEHLEQPVDSLKQLSTFLRPGGHFVVEVPNVNDGATAPSQKWHLGHLYNFNRHTLSAAGVKAGLTVQDCTAKDGVLFAMFKKPSGDAVDDLNAILTGSYEETHQILRDQTTAKHYLRLHVPIGRSARKLLRNVNEVLYARQFSNPKDILDSLFSQSGQASFSQSKAA